MDKIKRLKQEKTKKHLNYKMKRLKSFKKVIIQSNIE
jgi:hypothetical protein